ncbi:FYVE, RhoGEF and PH domain-containing protein 6-like isoform X3 [Rhodnius prolixus]
MAIIKIKCYCSSLNKVHSQLMEKAASTDKCERSLVKPPLLPKPKIISPSKKPFKAKAEPINPNLEEVLAQKDSLPSQVFVQPVISDELVEDVQNLSLSLLCNDVSSILQDRDKDLSIQLNDSELSALDSVEIYKESDSELSDTASQRSVKAFKEDLDSISASDSSVAYCIANELATSEKVYIETLRLIVFRLKDFLEEYSERNGVQRVIPEAELLKIVSSLPQLLSLNEDLYNDLKSRVDHWADNPKIADVIIKKGPFLKLYTTYIKEFETLCLHLEECRNRYPKFAEAINEFEALPICKSLNLKHYMLKPVQRIPQYRLLLQNYLNNIDVTSEEYADSQRALRIIEQVLVHTNDTLNLDNLSKLLQIQSKLGSHEIIKPGRKFLREGELFKLSRKEMQLRFFILLSDCLLYTTYLTMSTLKVNYELPLLGMKVQTNSTEKYEFSIITSTRSFTLRARSSNEYGDWVRSLQSAIEDNNQRQLTFATARSIDSSNSYDSLKLGQEAPVWIQDKRTTMCQICTAEFTMTFRRHHCRSCGKVVCSKCSSNKAPLAYIQFRCARVCKQCFDYLLKELMQHDGKLLELVKAEFGLEQDYKAISYLDTTLIGLFKKYDCNEKTKRFVPQRLKESFSVVQVAGDELGDITSSGWLMRRGRRGWKRLWFVLKDSVLYEYKASHDVVAHRSLPVLGYTVSRIPPNIHEDCNYNLAFSLNHPGQPSLIFLALSEDSCHMWISALTEATVLK